MNSPLSDANSTARSTVSPVDGLLSLGQGSVWTISFALIIHLRAAKRTFSGSESGDLMSAQATRLSYENSHRQERHHSHHTWGKTARLAYDLDKPGHSSPPLCPPRISLLIRPFDRITAVASLLHVHRTLARSPASPLSSQPTSTSVPPSGSRV